MAYESLTPLRSIKVTASFASKQYTFVTIDTNGQLASPSAGGDVIGIIQDDPAAGEVGSVCRPGDITKVKLGGSVSAGNDVTCDGNGAAVAATSADRVHGKALEGGSSGQLVTIIYQPKPAKKI